MSSKRLQVVLANMTSKPKLLARHMIVARKTYSLAQCSTTKTAILESNSESSGGFYCKPSVDRDTQLSVCREIEEKRRLEFHVWLKNVMNLSREHT